MTTRSIPLVGSIGKISSADAGRLSAYVVRGREVLAQAPVQSNGTFRVSLVRTAVESKSPYGLSVVVAPTGAGDHLEHVVDAPRIALDRASLVRADKDYRVSETIAISDALLKKWWQFCYQYCVSGTLVGPNGCPAPGADVTIYTVRYTLGGYTKIPRATVTTGPDGTFMACFPWCRCVFCFPCWPCWPSWWNCWPWWWEHDILHVIEAIERQPVPIGPGPVERASSLALFKPEGRALMRGAGFAASRKEIALSQDPNRTALIKSKLASSKIRALFPWWWWCCDDPNIVFSASQNGNLVLDENPSTDTRWCFENNSSVTLLANNQAITACPPGPQPESGFAWTRVGLVTVDQILQGYTNWWGGDAIDAAFGGSLDIYGAFAPGTNVSYYQVEAGQWTGDPARGGVAPASSSPLAADLYNYAYIYDNTATLVFSGPIKMGPFNQGGLVNLYATQEARQSGPTPPGLAAFPVIPPGGFVLWAYADRKVYTSSSTLVGGTQIGAVDLTLVGYDGTLNPVALVPDAPLTLTVDNTDLSAATVGVISAFRSNGTPATLTNAGECPAYDLGPGGYVQVPVTVTDASGHLYAYYLAAEHGHGVSETVTPPGMRAYVSNPLVIGADPNYAQKSWIGGTEIMTYYPPVDCCYEFRIRVGKRITDGYGGFGLGDRDFRTISLKVT
jgi:hypothetical protein